EPVTPVVGTATVLRLSRHGVEVAAVGPDAQVAARDVHGLARLCRADAAAAIAVGHVDPVVEAPGQCVDTVLLVALDETGIEDDLLIGLAVAIGVLRVENLRGSGHEDALTPRHDTGRKADVIEKDRRLVVFAVAPGALQELDAPAGLALAIDAERIVAH